jgi:hypothetical protein
MKQKNMLKRNSVIVLLLCLFFSQSLPTLAQTNKKKVATRSTAKGKKSNNKKPTQNSKKKDKKIKKKEFKRGSKEELKEWDKMKKDMKPLQLRDLIEENHRLRMQNKSLLEGKEFKEITNEYDIINEQNLLHESTDTTALQADLLGAGMAGSNAGANSNKGSGVTGLKGAGTVKEAGLAGAAGLAGIAGATAAAVTGRSRIDPSKSNQRGTTTNPTGKNSGIGTDGGSLSAADIAAMGAGAALGSMAMRELLDLPAGSYVINKETGQVLIGGIVDERYGVDPITGMPFIKGILFKVQIGAKDEINLRDKLANEFSHQTIEQEEGENLHKYTIGHFRNYWAADELKKLLRNIGIENAWIVPYKDEKRVLLKEVLSTVIEQKTT